MHSLLVSSVYRYSAAITEPRLKDWEYLESALLLLKVSCMYMYMRVWGQWTEQSQHCSVPNSKIKGNYAFLRPLQREMENYQCVICFCSPLNDNKGSVSPLSSPPLLIPTPGKSCVGSRHPNRSKLPLVGPHPKQR